MVVAVVVVVTVALAVVVVAAAVVVAVALVVVVVVIVVVVVTEKEQILFREASRFSASFLAFVELRALLPHSLDSASCPYPEPYQSCPCLVPLLEDPF